MDNGPLDHQPGISEAAEIVWWLYLKAVSTAGKCEGAKHHFRVDLNYQLAKSDIISSRQQVYGSICALHLVVQPWIHHVTSTENTTYSI